MTDHWTAQRLALLAGGIGGLQVVEEDGKLIGIVSRYDVLQQLIGTR